jgi:hypothetical protein
MRERLPARRAHTSFRFRFWNRDFTIGVGREPAGQRAPIREVFVNGGKSGEHIEILARDSAVLISLALQHGVPLGEMRHAITRNPDGSPMGPVGAILDHIHGEEVGEL